ncbi:MAG: hypothetical protein ACYS9Y_10780, partial [Planctomycetota bacterium]
MLSNMFGTNVAGGQVAVKQATVKNTNSNATVDSHPTPTTDNTPIVAQNRDDNKLSQRLAQDGNNGELSHRIAKDGDVSELPYKFRIALGEQINQQKTQKNQNKITTGAKISNFNVVSGENQAQLILTQEPITLPAVLAEPVAENTNNNAHQNTGVENSAEPAQSDNVSETLQLPVPSVQV